MCKTGQELVDLPPKHLDLQDVRQNGLLTLGSHQCPRSEMCFKPNLNSEKNTCFSQSVNIPTGRNIADTGE